MGKVTLNGTTLAESNQTISLEGNQYFPPDSINKELLTTSTTPYSCPWKGKATYYNAEVDGKVVKDVAWGYLQPKEAAKNIAGYLAFDKGKVKFE